MSVVHVSNTPTKQECKTCLYCDIYENRCIKYNAPAYQTGGICLHKGCTEYKRNDGRVPDWYEFIEDDDELDLTQQSVRGR
ncbi:MAG: hypothetical protein J5956_10770 [Ruminococcus sp.]|nr:hypothetical protein [Ruminococcus sp.]